MEAIDKYYLSVLKRYVNFSGRAGRQAFWMFVLFNFIISVALGMIDGVLGTNGILGSLYGLAVLIPQLGLSVRRLHDTGKSGWWLLIAFVPLLGILALIYFYVQDSQPGANQYGPNPKEMIAD